MTKLPNSRGVNALGSGVLEAGVDLGVGVGGFLDAPRGGRCRGVNDVEVDEYSGCKGSCSIARASGTQAGTR